LALEGRSGKVKTALNGNQELFKFFYDVFLDKKQAFKLIKV